MSDELGKPLVWDDSLATGVEEIDEQHRILVHILNEASASLAHAASAELMLRLSQDLLSYALYHFETEEQLMLEYGYGETLAADAERHLEEHRSFSARIVTIRSDLKAGRELAPSELIGFLRNWLVNHIQKTDKRFGAFVRAKRRS